MHFERAPRPNVNTHVIPFSPKLLPARQVSVAVHPPTINRPEHLQDTVDCINLYPVDEENELQKYLSGLPDDDVFDAMDLTEIGVARAHTISRQKSSILDDPDLSPKHRQFLLDRRFPYSLVPEVVTESESQNSIVSLVEEHQSYMQYRLLTS